MRIKDFNEVHHLYKYRYFDCNNYHINTIFDNEFYFASKIELNDPFDMSLRPRFENADEIQLCQNAESVINSADFVTEEEKKIKLQEVQNEIKTDKNNYVKDFIPKFYDSINKVGICSFTANIWNNSLMWAYYCHANSGFCIGINWEKLSIYLHAIKITPFIVNYVKDIVLMNPFIDNGLDAYTAVFCNKSEKWINENEIRLINLNGAKSILKIPADFIDEIIMGLNVSDLNEKLIPNFPYYT